MTIGGTSFKKLSKQHDLSLPSWGPYTKKYMGISHISNPALGVRFDLSVIPSYYRRKIQLPNVKWENNFHPWEASSDLDYYKIRYELEWKDRVYCDVSFSKIKDHSRTVQCKYVNNTAEKQNLSLHLMASIHYPTYPNSKEVIQGYDVILPKSGFWLDALAYETLKYKKPRHDDHLVNDGLFRGEERKNGFVNGRCLGNGFGFDSGDKVTYDVPLSHQNILMRFFMANDCTVSLLINGKRYFLQGNGSFQTLAFKIEESGIELESLGGSEVYLDGFALLKTNDYSHVSFKPCFLNMKPTYHKKNQDSIIMKYEDSHYYYGVKWLDASCKIREFCTDNLDDLMQSTAHNHVDDIFYENDKGHYTDFLIQPIFLEAHEEKSIYAVVCSGESVEEVSQMLKKENQLSNNILRTEDILEEGKKYLFSQDRMKATLLTNVVYPAYVKGSYIKHNTPGRWWDSLYTWDSGFIGIGLSDIDVSRAVDCLNAYVTEEDDDQRAFIHHGSPLPVQIYLLHELYNKTQSEELLKFFYDRIKSAYDFLIGINGLSDTNKFESSLLQTWSYFYNSGGWDDYPPQKYLHENKDILNRTTPVITTANIIRCGKILSQIAKKLNYLKDVEKYKSDICTLSEALQKHAWDKKSGYFSYVIHDEYGIPADHLEYHHENFNKGLDGLFPLIAGICTKGQIERFLFYLKSEERLWTDIGISTVDQSAGYYSREGYWNGAVWMPHQWFIWKTMLDLGEEDFAWQIAETALNLWQCEVENSYNCFEHFIIETGRGAGWHQFGGLSSPVINWFNAYFKVGALTVGFETLIIDKTFNDDFTSLTAVFESDTSSNCILVNMNPNENYDVYWNSKKIEYKLRWKGHLAISVAYGHGNVLQIKKQS